MPLSTGTRLGPYEVLSPLGAGGMGEVYRARDGKLARDVAVKVLADSVAASPHALARFEREAKAIAALSHPNVLSIFDFGTDAGVAYAVMELLEGQTLRAKLLTGPIPRQRALDYGLQIARGLSAAHERGIVHRDLKPENVFVTKDGHVKILDFGLAKRMEIVAADEEADGSTVSGYTEPGTVLGTVGYMSPEQVRGLPVDHRSDIFSLGTILYEMFSGKRAFKKNTAADTMAAILNEDPEELSGSGRGASPALEGVVRHCLEKEAEDRFQSVKDILFALSEAATRPLEAPTKRFRLPAVKARGVLLLAVAVVAFAAAAWFWQQASRRRWAREAAPEIIRLYEGRELAKAAALAKEARAVLPKDPTLEKLWLKVTGEASIQSEPSGAEVSMRLYSADPNSWEHFGTTPITKTRVSWAIHVFRVTKPGFTPMVFLESPSFDWTVKLAREGSVPQGMVPVAGGEAYLGWPRSETPPLTVDDFFIDRHEVTNREYKRFVDAGGYQKRGFWKHSFVKEGRELPWDEAISVFLDTTARPGPATWEAGTFPAGLADHPVAGVSWYEAAAYAEFAGKSLPTIHHWNRAAQAIAFSSLIVPASNFRGKELLPVGGSGRMSGFGTMDMAGNVKEWCWNESWEGKRFILGGGLGEKTYMFNFSESKSPWDRRPIHGFRCVKLLSPLSSDLVAKVEPRFRDYWKEKPVSDEVFAAMKSLYEYDEGELDAKLEETRPAEDWIREKVTINAAYGGERIPIYIHLPKNRRPPLQAVVYWPGGYAYLAKKFEEWSIEDDHVDFLPKSGRALIFPVYRGMYERADGIGTASRPRGEWRDRVIMQSKDLGRALDYLQTRKDIDGSKLAYYGFSNGGGLAPVLLANEPRFKAAILIDGGFWFRDPLPEVDWINFITRVKTPLLMLNGRYDDFFPVESSQRPFFVRAGTPEKDKRHVVYEAAHGDMPVREKVRESLDWLDKYLGRVER